MNTQSVSMQSVNSLEQRQEPSHVTLYIDTVAFAGTERHLLDLALGLQGIDVPVTLACPAESPLTARASALGVSVAAMPRGRAGEARAIEALRGFLCHDHSILHVHNGKTALQAALAVSLGGRGRVVKTQHFVSPAHASYTGVKAAISEAAHGWVNRRISGFLAISEAVRAQMLERGEAPAERIHLVPNGMSGIAASPEAALGIRREFGFGTDTPLLVCVARLEREKDILTLLRALPLVRRGVSEARLLVVGEGAERASLEAEARALGVADAVQFAGFREDARAAIAAADVFVLPSLEEPFGLVLLEAMALKRPIVATAVGGPLEIVADGVTGRLVPPAAPELFAAALQELLASPDLCRRMGEQGYSRYLSHYTAERMAQGTLEVYRSVLT